MNKWRWLAVAGMAEPVVRLGGLFGVGAMHPGYSHSRDFISELGAVGAPYRDLVHFGSVYPAAILTVLFAFALGRSQGGGGLARASGILLGISGLGFLVAGAFPCDPGCDFEAPSMFMVIHLAGAATMALCAALAPFVMGLRIVGGRTGRGYFLLGLVIAPVVFLAPVLLAVAGPGSSVAGIAQRVSFVLPEIWVFVSAWIAFQRFPDLCGESSCPQEDNG